MASIFERPNGTFQARIRGSDGRLITQVFPNERAALEFSLSIEAQKVKGESVTGKSRQISLDEYFEMWFEDLQTQASSGWRKTQKQIFRDHISPLLGKLKLSQITTLSVARILNHMAKNDYSEQMRLHVYILLRKLFADAIEIHQLISFNPVIRKIKPKIPFREAKHLNLDQIRQLLTHVIDKDYGLAIFVQIYLGLRIGELIALRWSDLDLQEGIAYIRRTYVRKESCFREYPKGRKQHSNTVPPELLEMLREVKVGSTSEYVVTSNAGEKMAYEWYCRRLQRYCRELELPLIGTHGLRHSTSEIYLSSGATKDDIRQLFAHSSPTVTDRYIHRRSNVDKVALGIRLFSTTAKAHGQVTS